MMATLTVTAKGQVTLRKEVLKHLGISPGDKIDLDLRPDGTIVGRAAVKAASGSIENFFGILASDNGPSLTIDEIKEAAAQGWASAMDYEKDGQS